MGAVGGGRRGEGGQVINTYSPLILNDSRQLERTIGMAKIPLPPNFFWNKFNSFKISIRQYLDSPLPRKILDRCSLDQFSPLPPFSPAHKVRRGEGRICGLSIAMIRLERPHLAARPPSTSPALTSKHRWLLKYASSPLQRGASTADFFPYDITMAWYLSVS